MSVRVPTANEYPQKLSWNSNGNLYITGIGGDIISWDVGSILGLDAELNYASPAKRDKSKATLHFKKESLPKIKTKPNMTPRKGSVPSRPFVATPQQQQYVQQYNSCSPSVYMGGYDGINEYLPRWNDNSRSSMEQPGPYSPSMLQMPQNGIYHSMNGFYNSEESPYSQCCPGPFAGYSALQCAAEPHYGLISGRTINRQGFSPDATSMAERESAMTHHPGESTIYIGNLPVGMEIDALAWLCFPYGPLFDVQIIRDKMTKASKGYAFVTFQHSQDARAAQLNLHGQYVPGPFGGANIKVAPSRRKSFVS